jgi:phosphotransferase system enzyme I (PtsI)
MISLKGLGVSPGVARGEALVLRQRARHRYYLVPSSSVDREVARLAQARDRGRGQLEEITQRIATLAGAAPASLFEAQLLMLDDPMLLQRASDLIRARRQNAEWAVQQAGDELADMFNQADDPYLRERKGDLQDVIGRLRMNLSGEAGSGWLVSPVGAPCIIVADDLPPSVAAQIEWTRTLGFITEVGSWTYHTAILARSLGVPAIVGIHEATRRIAPGADVILDGATGDVFVDATDEVRTDLLRRRSERASTTVVFSAPRDAEPVTRDGVRIRLDANLELPEDLPDAVQAGAEGIGLYRSEFLLAGGPASAMSEDAQVAVYRDLLTRMPGEVTIRTLDPGEIRVMQGDRTVRSRPGLRALSFDAAFRAQFESQITALLRASTAGRLRILLPFVTSADEVHEARSILNDVTTRLRAEGVAVPVVPLGAMVEVPSAAITADRIAQEADFFSIGTNDLIALTLAADRADQRPPQLYEPLHPAVLRLLRFVCRAGRARGRRVALCGEMASDPALLVLLIGLGLREFSMGPSVIPRARHLVRHVSVAEARTLAREVLSLDPEDARQRLNLVVQRADEIPVAGTSR